MRFFILSILFIQSAFANYNLTNYITKNHLDKEETFSLIDVGASKGISPIWYQFGDHLEGIGFEPLIAEAERLNQLSSQNVKYLPYFITAEDPHIDSYRQGEYPTNPVLKRSSAWETYRLQNRDHRETFNNHQKLNYTDQKISLNRFCQENHIDKVNFIKTDTDGHDIKVLIGASSLLKDPDLLGLMIECDLVESDDPRANAFRNIDALMVKNGFTLFSLESYKYTKKHLPGKYTYSFAAQTRTGQIAWADAVYFRDLVKLKADNQPVSNKQVLKMACLFELFKLHDCAAELLMTFADQLPKDFNLSHCLDLLTTEQGLSTNYNHHIKTFQKNSRKFYSGN